MSLYTVYRLANGDPGVHARVDGEPLTHVAIHSPDGFECSYDGSGPADLALAILVDHFKAPTGRVEYLKRVPMDLPARKAWALHQIFKRRFVVKAPQEGFHLSTEEIDTWLQSGEPQHVMAAIERIWGEAEVEAIR